MVEVNHWRIPAQWRVMVCRDLAYGRQAALRRPDITLAQKGYGVLRRGLPELLGIQPEMRCPHGLEVAVLQLAERLLLPGGKSAGILAPHVPAPCSLGMGQLLGPPDLVHGVVEELEHMKRINGQLGIRDVGLHALTEGRRPSTADLPHLRGISAMGVQIGRERVDGAGILACGRKQHLGSLHVYTEGASV